MRAELFCLAIITGAPLLMTAEAQVPADLPIMRAGLAESGFAVALDSHDSRRDWLADPEPSAGGGLEMRYPGGPSSPGVVFITRGPALPRERKASRESIDVSMYQAMIVEMKTDAAAAEVSIGIKDANDDDFGYEPKVLVHVSSEWQQIYLPLSWFRDVDLKHLYVVSEFVFVGDQPRKVYVRSIRYTGVNYAHTRILPHVVFGGGWSSALYFTNTGGALREFRVNFVAGDGSPLSVPVSGGSSSVVGLTISLQPKTTSVVELLNNGSLNQGYAVIGLPPDVIGYGVIRQTIQGQADQRAILPFSNPGAMQISFVWDETDSVTTVALVNVTDVDTTVLITVRNDTGQVIATPSLTLPANTKAAAIMREVPGLSGMAGKRGSADFTARTGNLAVLPLRFTGASLTAIPTVVLAADPSSDSAGH